MPASDPRVLACRELAAMLATCAALLGGDRHCGEEADSGPAAVRCLDLVTAVASGEVQPDDVGEEYLGAAMAVAVLVCDKAMLRFGPTRRTDVPDPSRN